MSHDIHQWIAEIQSLQQQVAQLQRDRDTAIESAANWRQLYNTEAEQRRIEAKRSQQEIETLSSQIQQLQAEEAGQHDGTTDATAIAARVKQWQTVEELQAKLVEVFVERDRLTGALKIEREAHAKTRQDLTTALGDTVDLLAKHKGNGEPILAGKDPTPDSTKPDRLPEPPLQPLQLPEPIKNPSLRLPPTRPAPPRP